MIWIDVPDHHAEPTGWPVTVCQVCGGAVRTAGGGLHPVHAQPQPQRMEVPCDHRHVESDDDGLSRRFFVCSDCHTEVVPTEPDEDGESFWEALY